MGVIRGKYKIKEKNIVKLKTFLKSIKNELGKSTPKQ